MSLTSWYNSEIKSDVAIISSLVSLLNPISAAATVANSELKSAASAWYKKYLALKALDTTGLSHNLISERLTLLSRGANIVSKIRALGMSVDGLANVGTLGSPTLVLIGAGVIMTSAALMLYWVYDYRKFRLKYLEFKALVSNGASASSAANTVNSLEPKTFTGNLVSVAKYLVYGFIGISAYKLLTRGR